MKCELARKSSNACNNKTMRERNNKRTSKCTINSNSDIKSTVNSNRNRARKTHNNKCKSEILLSKTIPMVIITCRTFTITMYRKISSMRNNIINRTRKSTIKINSDRSRVIRRKRVGQTNRTIASTCNTKSNIDY